MSETSRRAVLAGLGALTAAGPALAQTETPPPALPPLVPSTVPPPPLPGQAPPPPPPPAVEPAPVPAAPPAPPAIHWGTGPKVAIKTTHGTIVVELAADRAPITSENFLTYVRAGHFDGANFYRAMKLAANPLTGLIQGGQRPGARSFPAIAHESTAKTGLSNKDGALTMARGAPGTATSDFFICVGDMSGLDANPSQPGDNKGYAVFGHVIEGMEVVRRILVAPTSPTKGASFGMKGQMLEQEVTIISAKRI